MIMRIAYGIEVDAPGNDKYISIAEKGLAVFAAALVPGKYLVETFPILRHLPAWFPGAQFKRDGKQWKPDALAVLETPWNMATEMAANGTAPSSIAKTLMERISRLPSEEAAEEEDIARSAAGVIYGGTSLAAPFPG